MGGRRIETPLYVFCQRPGCEGYARVTNRSKQRTRKFCSRRCAALAQPQSTLSTEARSRGGKTRAQRARRRLMQRIAGMSAIEAFRVGYVRGLQSKWRKTRAKLGQTA